MLYHKGDRIQALRGVCPGSYGVVTVDQNQGNAVRVTYDHGRTDIIPVDMIVLVEHGDEYGVDD